MVNLALYRKYRPQKFSEVVGQEYTVQALKNAVASNTVSHAYLFAGPRGTGKTSLARLLAKAVNCKKRRIGEGEPCNECSSCREITAGRSLDLIEIDAASNRGINEIRELKDGIGFLPVKSKYKVFIIDEAHQLTKEAANALLKTLEEPPEHAIFILATTEPQKMISTIISRCQKFDFRRLKIPEIVKTLEMILKSEKIEFEESGLTLIAREAQGSLRDAEGMLDQVISFVGQGVKIKKESVAKVLGTVSDEIILQFLQYLEKKDAKSAIAFFDGAVEKGTDPQQFLKNLLNFLREILLLKINSSLNDSLILSLAQEERQQIKKFSTNFSREDLEKALNFFMRAEDKIKYSSLPQLPIELAILEVCHKVQNN